MTIQQRKEAYKWALEQVKSSNHHKDGVFLRNKRSIWGVCELLAMYVHSEREGFSPRILDKDEYYIENTGHIADAIDLFYPEFCAQKPENAHIFWWPTEDDESRIQALEAAIVLCEAE